MQTSPSLQSDINSSIAMPQPSTVLLRCPSCGYNTIPTTTICTECGRDLQEWVAKLVKRDLVYREPVKPRNITVGIRLTVLSSFLIIGLCTVFPSDDGWIVRLNTGALNVCFVLEAPFVAKLIAKLTSRYIRTGWAFVRTWPAWRFTFEKIEIERTAFYFLLANVAMLTCLILPILDIVTRLRGRGDTVAVWHIGWFVAPLYVANLRQWLEVFGVVVITSRRTPLRGVVD